MRVRVVDFEQGHGLTVTRTFDSNGNMVTETVHPTDLLDPTPWKRTCIHVRPDGRVLEIVKPEKLDLEDVANLLEDRITSNGIKRAVIDSATMIRLSFKSEIEYRQTLFEFLSLLRNLDVTTITTVEATSARREDMRFDIEHFVMDGIINLYNLDREDRRVRALEVFKMRGTDHSRDLVPFKVTPNGIKVYVGEKVF